MAKQADLRAFRRAVSTLKKQGVIPASVDARRAKPSDKLKGKRLSTVVNQWDDIVSGKATAVKVTPERFKQYKKTSAYRTVNGRLIVPHSATEKVRVRGGKISIENPKGLKRVQIPVPYHNLEQYLDGIRREASTINKQKRRSQFFGFRVFGYGSSEVSRTIEHLVDLIEGYESVTSAGDNPKAGRSFYQNLEFIILDKLDQWEFPSSRTRAMNKRYNAERRKRFDENLKTKPLPVQEQYKESKRERQARYRERIRADKNRSKQYKKDAIERRKKSDANKAKAKRAAELEAKRKAAAKKKRNAAKKKTKTTNRRSRPRN